MDPSPDATDVRVALRCDRALSPTRRSAAPRRRLGAELRGASRAGGDSVGLVMLEIFLGVGDPSDTFYLL